MMTPPNRREFLKTMLATAAGVQFFGLITQRARAAVLPSKMNFLLIMTDQERPPLWFPAGWEEANLPNTTRLKNSGLSFTHAFCCTAMCTPSRASLFTGLFPAQHHSPWTLTEDFTQTAQEPQLDPTLPNLATCLREAGYDVVYKGKWHMSHGARGADGEWVAEDISRYGFDGWEAPDAGGDTRLENFGGGLADHDQRYVDDAKAFLDTRIQNPAGKPFCLIVSLVNPHDVLAYPGVMPGDPEGTVPYYVQGGYDESWLAPTTPEIPLPPTVGEELLSNYKPTSHAAIKAVMAAGLGVVATPDVQKKYLNFYGNLLKKVDGQIGELLEAFDAAGAVGQTTLNNTLIIRTSDHGEMGLCHGALRQKTFLAYDEALRVPLIWSNPLLFPEPRTTEALVSHVDFLPTLCSLADVPERESKGFAGVDYSSLLLDPAAPPVQDHILFTFDDIYSGGDAATFPNGTVPPPNCLRVVRTKDFKYARYFDQKGEAPEQQEFYDLRPSGGDFHALHGLPLEMHNLSLWAEARRLLDSGSKQATPAQELERTRMMAKLATLEAERLAPRPYAPSSAPEKMQLEIKRWNDPHEGPQAKVQLTFFSHLNTRYRLQRSLDLSTWDDAGPTAIGNGGMIVMSDPLTTEKAFYRVVWAPIE